MQEQVLELPVELIDPSPYQPRTRFDDEDLKRLAKSLKEDSLLQRIVVRPKSGDLGGYELIFGERRLRAAKLARWKKIPASIRNVEADEAHRMIGVELFHHEPLSVLEKASYLQALYEDGNTDAAIGKMFNQSRPWSTNLRRLLQLPSPWRDRLATGELSDTKARALLRYKQRPDVLKAIAIDLDDNPNLYRTRDLFEARIAVIADALESVSGDDDHPNDAPPRTVRNTQSAAPTPLTESQAIILLRPYLTSRADLETILQVVREALDEFTETINESVA